jgi:hypothetical protein
MAKFLIINRPPPHRTKAAPVGECVNHFVELDRSNRAQVYPIVGYKGYATLVDVDDHDELRQVVRGNAMGHIEEYTILALADLGD